MNKHDDHVASCLCCAFCATDFESDISDVTPGEGWTYRCKKDVWSDPFLSGDELHTVIAIGSECPLFLPSQFRMAKNKSTGEERPARIFISPTGSMIEFKDPDFVTTIPIFDKQWTWA
jgi:hypothetical protein